MENIIKSKINYKAEVLKKYPDAKCIGIGVNNSGVMWHMIIGCDLGENYNDTKSLAWKYAYDKAILQQISKTTHK